MLQLRKELAQLKMGVLEPVTKYTSRAIEIQDQLRAIGYDVTDQEVAWAVLAGLPPSYDMVVTVAVTCAFALLFGCLIGHDASWLRPTYAS
jgi:hypothetical protein